LVTSLAFCLTAAWADGEKHDGECRQIKERTATLAHHDTNQITESSNCATPASARF